MSYASDQYFNRKMTKIYKQDRERFKAMDPWERLGASVPAIVIGIICLAFLLTR